MAIRLDLSSLSTLVSSFRTPGPQLRQANDVSPPPTEPSAPADVFTAAPNVPPSILMPEAPPATLSSLPVFRAGGSPEAALRDVSIPTPDAPAAVEANVSTASFGSVMATIDGYAGKALDALGALSKYGATEIATLTAVASSVTEVGVGGTAALVGGAVASPGVAIAAAPFAAFGLYEAGKANVALGINPALAGLPPGLDLSADLGLDLGAIDSSVDEGDGIEVADVCND